MAELLKLHNQIKHYEWGSADLIPRLLGTTGDGSPWAELWMGSYSDLSSRVPSHAVSLGDLIARDPRRYLGEKTAGRYGELPFLFKLLAVEKPLSVQVHPNMAQAREGFERENKAQIAYNAPNRNYRDPHHKPEILCALTPFTGMCGFRPPAEIKRHLSVFHASAATGGPAPALVRESFTPLLHALEMPEPAVALRNFLDALFGLSLPVREALTQCILSMQGDGAGGESYEWELMRNLARQYPGDPTIIAPLYLAIFHLKPGEAVFLKAGAPHSYVHGFGVELMSNSDNVLRGGLTAKHIDIPELMKVLDFNAVQPHIIKPEPDSGSFTYPAPCEEFSLTVMRGKAGGGAQPAAFARNAPAICIVTEGEVSICGTVFKQGEAVFIPAGGDNGKAADPLVLQGQYTLYAASVSS